MLTLLTLVALQLPQAALHVEIISVSSVLVQSSDLVYQGSFKLPQGQIGTSSFSYGGSALAFNEAHNSLFLVGHPYQQQVAEISIPALGETAVIIQPFTDLSEGRMLSVGQSPCCDNPQVGGLLVYKGQLYESVYLYYDGTASQVLSHFTSGLDLLVRSDISGPYQIGAYGLVPGQNTAGFVDGWMVHVPSEWQSALGGPVLVGQCCIPIISRTSLGPSAFAIDPAQIGSTPAPAVPLLYYTGQHVLPDQGGLSLANVTTQMGGAVFPEGTRSLLFFGRIGLGKYCYGEGTSDKSLDGTGPPADPWCYDPAEGSKGPHMYPYEYFVWAYDAVDLTKVKQGLMQPWDVRPYATWPLILPNPISEQIIQGVTYDPSTNRIFVAQYHGDVDRPLIHVFHVKL